MRPARGTPVYVALIIGIWAVALLKVPPVPFNDPAFFEYFGRAMLHGQRLYEDLADVKLPSIYVVNALWQALFGDAYRLHTLAEGLVALGSIGLFAVVLRAAGVARVGLASVAFAAFSCLPFWTLDFPQHYAVFFILLAVYAALRGRDAIAGAALLLATTFWTPAIFTAVPLLLRGTGSLDPRVRAARLAGGFAVAGLAYYAVCVPFLGPAWPLAPLALWPSNFAGLGARNDFSDLRVTVTASGLGPAIGALLCLLIAVVRRPQTEAQRFALCWSGAALAGTAFPPRFFEHYLLPSVPALCMAVAAYWPPRTPVPRRAVAFALGVVCIAFSAKNASARAVAGAGYAGLVLTAGDWIRQGAGSGRVLWTDEYVPELELTADAALPDPAALLSHPGGLPRGTLHTVVGGSVRDTAVLVATEDWKRWPELVVYGPFSLPDPLQPSLTVALVRTHATQAYALVCGSPVFGGRLAVYAFPIVAQRLRCR